MQGAPPQLQDIFCAWSTYPAPVAYLDCYRIGGRGLICRALPQAHLGELALLVDEGDDVHGFVGDHVQGILVVCELDVHPVDALQVILLLLQLEHVPHKELLQVLIGKVDAELLKAAGRGRGQGAAGQREGCSGPALPLRGDPSLVVSVPLGFSVSKVEKYCYVQPPP